MSQHSSSTDDHSQTKLHHSSQSYTFQQPAHAPPRDALPIWNIFDDPSLLSCHLLQGELSMLAQQATRQQYMTYYAPHEDPLTQINTLYNQCMVLQENANSNYSGMKSALDNIEQQTHHEEPHIWPFRESYSQIKPFDGVIQAQPSYPHKYW